MFPVQEARAHIRALAARHDIVVHWIKDGWGESEANVYTRQVWVPRPTTALRYAIALHEFGHILDKVSAKVVKAPSPECEAAAWRWAIAHMRPELRRELTVAHWRRIGNAWATSLSKHVPPMR